MYITLSSLWSLSVILRIDDRLVTTVTVSGGLIELVQHTCCKSTFVLPPTLIKKSLSAWVVRCPCSSNTESDRENLKGNVHLCVCVCEKERERERYHGKYHL